LSFSTGSKNSGERRHPGSKKRASDIEQNVYILSIWKDADPGPPEIPDAKARLAGLKSQVEEIRGLILSATLLCLRKVRKLDVSPPHPYFAVFP
jgi:hypothetical protein